MAGTPRLAVGSQYLQELFSSASYAYQAAYRLCGTTTSFLGHALVVPCKGLSVRVPVSKLAVRTASGTRIMSSSYKLFGLGFVYVTTVPDSERWR